MPVAITKWLMRKRSKWRGEKHLIQAYMSDYQRYRKYSYNQFSANQNLQNLSAMIIMEAHAVEKGFSLPNIRPAYGEERIRHLISLMSKYRRLGYECQTLAFQKAQSVLAEYIRYHDQINFDLGSRRQEIMPWIDMDCCIGGYTTISRSELLSKAGGNFHDCSLSRYSIRSYSKEPVPESVIRDALELARKTPSVCNRQAWHTYIIKNPDLKTRVLAMQNGNRGFGSHADFLAVITIDIQSFIGAGERNESFVDGGLYSMSLLYSFHYYGIGACPLNWMVRPPQDQALRDLLGIKASENIIMIISAGYIPESVRIAKSVRKRVSDQVSFL